MEVQALGRALYGCIVMHLTVLIEILSSFDMRFSNARGEFSIRSNVLSSIISTRTAISVHLVTIVPFFVSVWRGLVSMKQNGNGGEVLITVK